eukprot:m.210038 g.210038  ORF g.210038 m.210038 type:complete len:83 (-) comp53955_c0_seq16:420-668(-)
MAFHATGANGKPAIRTALKIIEISVHEVTVILFALGMMVYSHGDRNAVHLYANLLSRSWWTWLSVQPSKSLLLVLGPPTTEL